MTGSAKPPRVIEFVRVSTDKQQDAGTPGMQLEAFRQVRKTREGRIVGRVYPRQGISGAKGYEDRPDLHELERLVRTHGLDELRVYKIDRLSRAASLRDRYFVVDLCVEQEAVIYDCSANRAYDPTDENDVLVLLFEGSMARRELVTFHKRTADGRKRAAREGRLAGGRPPYGFVWIEPHKDETTGHTRPGEVRVKEAVRPIIELVFKLVASGMPCTGVARRLNAEGYPTEKATRWTNQKVISLVRKTAYRGLITQTQGGEEFELRVPPIVSEMLWQAANDAIDRRAKYRRGWRTTPKGLLQGGLLKCGECGKTMYRDSRVRTSRKSVTYRCASMHDPKRMGPPCGNGRHIVDDVDAAVWEEVCRIVSSPNIVAELAKAAGGEELASWEAQVAACQKKLDSLVGVERSWLKKNKAGLLSDQALDRELAGLAKDRKIVEATLQVAQDAIEGAAQQRRAAGQAAKVVAQHRASLARASRKEKREIIRALVPEREGFGVFIDRRGQVEIVGGVPVAEPRARRHAES